MSALCALVFAFVQLPLALTARAASEPAGLLATDAATVAASTPNPPNPPPPARPLPAPGTCLTQAETYQLQQASANLATNHAAQGSATPALAEALRRDAATLETKIRELRNKPCH